MLALLGAVAVLAAPPETLTYTLAPNPETGGIRVELAWETRGRTVSVLGVSARWGNIDNVSALLGDVQIDGCHGVQQQQSRWILRHGPRTTIRCAYDFDPGRKSFQWDGTHYPITTRTFFHGIGNAFLMVPEPGGDAPREFQVVLRWKLPNPAWRAVASWGVGKALGDKLDAGDLRHSVYLAGELAIQSAERDGRRVTVALPDKFGFTPAEFLKMAGTIVGQQCDYLNERNFPAFIVTAIPVGDPLKEGDSRIAGSGLYHSFALWIPPRAKLNDAVEHLFAHELFHYWNGRLLPAAQPEGLVYWFVEGFTDYYALRILHESGQWSSEQYAKWINRHIREYVANPAIHATNEEIRDEYWRQRSTVGEVAYQRGLMLGLRWDRLARQQGVRNGLDRLFFALLDRARAGGFELSNDAIRRVGVEQLGAWFAGEFDQFVVQARTVSVPVDALAPKLIGSDARVYDYDPGFDRERSLQQQKIIGLKRGSAAERAGLREGDEMLGYSLLADPEKQSELKVMRKGELRTIRYFPRGPAVEALQFKPAESATRGDDLPADGIRPKPDARRSTPTGSAGGRRP
ncbi:MAG: hypothetical protein AB7Q17_00645 [Phycisphaerae bacterium]